MKIEYIIVLLLIGIFLIVIMYIEPMLAKHKVKNSNEYGSARFSSFREIKTNFKKEKQKKEINITNMTFQELFNEFYEYKKDKVKITTLKTYRGNVKELKELF